MFFLCRAIISKPMMLQSNNENDDLISVLLQDDILYIPQGRENVRFPEKTSFVFLERHPPPPGTC